MMMSGNNKPVDASDVPLRKSGPLQAFKVAVIVVFLVAGLAGIGLFTWQLNSRAVWKCFTLVLACSILLRFNILAMQGKIAEKFTLKRMRKLRRIGIILAITSSLLCVSFLLHAHLLKQDFTLDSYYAAAVPGFLSMAWFIQVAIEADEYCAHIPDTENYAVMVEDHAARVV